MRALITGVTGFVGRHLCEHCAAQGADVIGLGRGPYPGGLPLDELPSVADYIHCDMLNAEHVADAVRRTAPDLVFHLAALAAVARSWEQPSETISANVTMAVNLLEALRLHAPAAKVLIACSGEEYGVPRRVPVMEDDPLEPRNPYAVSKAAVDWLAGLYHDARDLNVVRTRAFNHAGPGQSDTYVVSAFARQIAEAEAADETGTAVEIVTGNLEARRDFTDVRDVVGAYWLALERAKPGAYNVSSAEATAIADILARLAALSHLEVRHRIDPERLRPHEVMEITASHDKLTQATGWEPRIPLDQTLRDTLDWWRARAKARVVT